MALAFIGDGVYELLVRGHLLDNGNLPAKTLHRMAVEQVNAPAQAEVYNLIAGRLTADESEILRRAKNSKISRIPKSSSIEEYHKATAVEALFGYLYLGGEIDRILELFSMIRAGQEPESTQEVAAFDIRPIDEPMRPLVAEFLVNYWHVDAMIVRGERIAITKIDGFVVLEKDSLVGVATYIVRGDACEIVTLNSLHKGGGIGSALIDTVAAEARRQRCKSLRLITTNDNIYAIGYYQKRGFELAGMNLGAIDREREIIPAVPLIGENGLPMRHAINFVMDLQEEPDNA